MSACEVYFKSKIQPLEMPLVKFVTKEELEKAINISFPLLIIKEDEFQTILKMIKNFYVGFDGYYYKLKTNDFNNSPIL